MRNKQKSSNEEIVFPPCIQNDLMTYLKPEHQKMMRSVLRPLKQWAQQELCSRLMDWLETGVSEPGKNFVISPLYLYLIEKIEPLKKLQS